MILALKYARNWLKATEPASLGDRWRKGSRYYAGWRASLGEGRNSLKDGLPWIVIEACEFLETILKPESSVFEYGSGGSTIFFSRKCARVVSIEGDPAWIEYVKRALAREGLNNCDYRLIRGELAATKGDPTDPNEYFSSGYLYENFYYKEYVRVMDAFADQSFDFISVDGRARPASIRHAMPKLKPGGYMLLDDSHRQGYRRARELLSGWEMNEFNGPVPYNKLFSQTTVWRKP